MSTVLQTSTELSVVVNDFTLTSLYSGEVNPNVTFDVLFTVTDGLNALVGVSITINSLLYITDGNGQVSVSLTRGDYSASVTLTGYTPQTVTFTILDINVTENIVLVKIGSFDESYDESYT